MTGDICRRGHRLDGLRAGLDGPRRFCRTCAWVAHERYRTSPKGRAALQRYQRSAKGQATRRRCDATQEARARHRASQARWRAKRGMIAP